MKKRLSLLLLGVLFFTMLRAQNDIANEMSKKFSTPIREDIDVSGFENNHSVGVNAYNGEFNFSIDLATIQGIDLSYQLGLSYTSGIKVSDRAGVVGMGWNLALPGSISREINGFSDFFNENLVRGVVVAFEEINLPTSITSNPEVEYSCPMLSFENSSGQGNFENDAYFNELIPKDTERDIFTLNVPGFSCHFYFENSNTIKVIESSNIKVISKPNNEGYNENTNCSWEIQLDNGFVYFFGTSREARNYIQHASFNPFFNPNQVLAWNLEKIISPSGEVIEFQYDLTTHWENNSTILSTGSTYMELPLIEYVNNPGYAIPVDQYSPAITPYTQEYSLLKEVSYSVSGTCIEKVILNYSNNRIDSDNDFELTEVQTKTRNSINTFEIVSSFYLNYHFLNNRLWLKDIHKKSSQNTNFPGYNFEYSSMTSFPALESFARDFFGYYNGSTGNTSLFPSQNINGTSQECLPSYSTLFGVQSSDRMMHPDFTIFGNLISISTPMGAKIEVDYEPGYENIGNRVKQLKVFDDDLTTCNVSNYSYVMEWGSTQSSGKYLGLPVKFNVTTATITHQADNPWQIDNISLNPGGINHIPIKGTMHTSSSVTQISNSAQGKEVGYSVVFISYGTNSDLGLERLEFRNEQDQYNWGFTSGMTSVAGFPIDTDYKVPSSTKSFTNGNIIRKTIYQNNQISQYTPKIVQEYSYNNKTTSCTGSIITNLASYMAVSPGWGCSNSGAVAEWCNLVYYIRTFETSQIKEVKVTYIDDQNNELRTSETFNYNAYGKLSSKSSYQNEQLLQTEINSYYPLTNVSGEMTAWQLEDDFRILLAEKKIIRNNQIIAGEKFEYSSNSQLTKSYVYNRDYSDNNHYELAAEYFYEGPYLIESRKQGLPKNTVKIENGRQVASLTGANFNESYINNFDNTTNLPIGLITTSDPYLGTGCSQYTGAYNFNLSHPRWNSDYRIEFSYKSPFQIEMGYRIVDINTGLSLQGDQTIATLSPTSQWGLFNSIIDLANIDMNGKKIVIYFNPIGLNGPFYLDELRIYPKSARIETFNFDNTGKITSKLDVNYYKETYEYDNLDNLLNIRNFENFIVKSSKITYKAD